jgi:HSP20 family molecular chaperone IbpA
LVAEVPGPQEQVKIEVLERKIKIIGGKDFSREVNLSKKVELLNSSYINGMLNITLKKV